MPFHATHFIKYFTSLFYKIDTFKTNQTIVIRDDNDHLIQWISILSDPLVVDMNEVDGRIMDMDV